MSGGTEPTAYVDREARDRLATAVEDYLTGGSTSFEFDDQISAIRSKTKDKTVDWAGYLLWLLYDDCKAHKVVISRDGWNFVQRLLLILRTDARIRRQITRVWSWHQLVASAALACFALLVLRAGWGRHLIALSMPLGVVSILLSKSRRRISEREVQDDRLLPFASISEVFAVRRAACGFKKQPYPPHLGEGRIRSAAMQRIVSVPAYLTWLMFSPVVLVAQVLPRSRQRMSVEAGSEAGRYMGAQQRWPWGTPQHFNDR